MIRPWVNYSLPRRTFIRTRRNYIKQSCELIPTFISLQVSLSLIILVLWARWPGFKQTHKAALNLRLLQGRAKVNVLAGWTAIPKSSCHVKVKVRPVFSDDWGAHQLFSKAREEISRMFMMCVWHSRYKTPDTRHWAHKTAHKTMDT